eukprot:2859778-Prymnesium_polylepis.1
MGGPVHARTRTPGRADFNRQARRISSSAHVPGAGPACHADRSAAHLRLVTVCVRIEGGPPALVTHPLSVRLRPPVPSATLSLARAPSPPAPIAT